MFIALDAAVAPFYQVFKIRHPRPASAPLHPNDSDVARFNAAAEEYFARYPTPADLVRKPFSEPGELSRRLIDLGVLIDALRIAPGDVVLELGAGPCWVSHFLNRFGCRTIAVDVSATALSIGRARFARDPDTNFALRPAFICYDGRTIPLADASVDGVVLYDVFHHLPNVDPLLREMHRVLRDGGIVAMSEPGRGHASSAPSRAESKGTGVLENELVLEDIGAHALAAGFTAARFVAAANRAPMEIDVAGFRSFLGGRGLSRYWAEFAAALDSHYYVVLFKGPPEPTTRRPRRLRAGLRLIGAESPLRVRAGTPTPVTLVLSNTGDTRWLSGEGGGWTRVGAHLFGAGGTNALLHYDWARWPLPCDVPAGRSVEVRCELPPIIVPGTYGIEVDLVVEGRAWFAQRESASLLLECTVA